MHETVVVASFRTRAEAELAALSLNGAGVPFLIQSSEGMMHGPFAPGAEIRVPASAAAAARDLLQDVTDASALGAEAPRRLVALGTYPESELGSIVERLDAVHVPYVIEHPEGDATSCVVFVRREHQLPAGRAIHRA